MKVVLVFRSRSKGGQSIEGIFSSLKTYETEKIKIESWEINPHKSIFRNVLSLRRCRADAYHITGDITYYACFLLGKPIILTIHDIGRYKELKGWKKWLFSRAMIRWPISVSKYITTVSQFTAQDIISHFRLSRLQNIQIIPNGYNPIFTFHPREFNKTCPRLLHVGTAMHKNLHTVIEAASQMNCTLTIIGALDNPTLELIRGKNIHFENWINVDVQILLQQYIQADILVFVSTHEGFGMPIIEAQAVGRPVISSRMTSIPEVAGRGALFLDNPFDAAELANAIYRVMHDDPYRESLIAEGLRNAQRYNYFKMAQSYLNLYSQLADK